MTNDKSLHATFVPKSNPSDTTHNLNSMKNKNDIKEKNLPSTATKSNRTPVRKKSEDEEDNLKSRCGFFRKAIPIMPKSLAIACCIMNIVFPGLGKCLVIEELFYSYFLFCFKVKKIT